MPKARRPSAAAAAADTRPAFNRPPGAKVKPTKKKESPAVSPKRTPRPGAKDSPTTSPIKQTHRHTEQHHRHASSKYPSRSRAKHISSISNDSANHLLSADSLAKLNAHNEKVEVQQKELQRKKKEKQYRNIGAQKRRKKNRNVSGAIVEEGRAKERRAHVRHRGGAGSVKEFLRHRGGKGNRGRGLSRKALVIVAVIVIILLIILIPVGVLVVGRRSEDTTPSTGVSTANLKDVDPNSIPAAAKGTDLDPFTWHDTTDFNVTYTDEEVGGLSVMGLMSEYDDSTRPNDNVPPLNEQFDYGKVPIRGVNVGGWLAIEPFISPSLFDEFATDDDVVDEYTLTKKLGPGPAKTTLEAHYATFINEQSFVEIVEAGFDHVRMPFGYWAVRTYEGDPYVPKTSWRYLLRAIEWCRKYGLRVKLDVHGLPGSQNGWNHSGKWGPIGWLNGSDGNVNGQRSLDMHDQLSQFFAQDRYKNIVTLYGLANEPKMKGGGNQEAVLQWNQQAIDLIRGNGFTQYIVFGDGFIALDKWEGEFQDVDEDLIMDTHQYVIFNTEQLGFSRQDKINMACQGWSRMFAKANDPSTG